MGVGGVCLKVHNPLKLPQHFYALLLPTTQTLRLPHSIATNPSPLYPLQVPVPEKFLGLDKPTPPSYIQRMDDLTPITSPQPWPPMLALELAMKAVPVPELMEAYGLEPEGLSKILANPAFQAEVRAAQEKLKQEGYSFKVKAGALAETLLPKVAQIINDDDTPANARQKFMDSLVRWAGYDKVGDEQKGGAAGGGLQVVINLGEPSPKPIAGQGMQTITATAERV